MNTAITNCMAIRARTKSHLSHYGRRMQNPVNLLGFVALSVYYTDEAARASSSYKSIQRIDCAYNR